MDNWPTQEGFKGEVLPLALEDIDALRPILSHWIKDRNTQAPLPEEVETDLLIMEKSIRGENGHKFVVAKSESGEVIGVMGLRIPREEMLKYVSTTYAVELVNAYVAPDHSSVSNNEGRKSKGVGRALVNELIKFCQEAGYSEIVVNSGPRYKETAWGFYDKVFGERIGLEEGLYGPGGDAPVWRMEF